MVFTALIASAPASRAITAMPADIGQHRGKFRDDRKSGPRPAVGHDALDAAPVGPELDPAGVGIRARQVELERRLYPGVPSSSPMTWPYSSMVNPTMLTNTRARVSRWAAQGRNSSRTRKTPGLARPTEFNIPPGNSAARGAGFPDRGWRETDLVIRPPRRSRSTTPASSLPKPAVPAARRMGFWKCWPNSSRERSGRPTRVRRPAWLGWAALSGPASARHLRHVRRWAPAHRRLGHCEGRSVGPERVFQMLIGRVGLTPDHRQIGAIGVPCSNSIRAESPLVESSCSAASSALGA